MAKHYQTGADSCACGKTWPCPRRTRSFHTSGSMKERWTKERLQAVIQAVEGVLNTRTLHHLITNPKDLEIGMKRLYQELACVDKPGAW